MYWDVMLGDDDEDDGDDDGASWDDDGIRAQVDSPPRRFLVGAENIRNF